MLSRKNRRTPIAVFGVLSTTMVLMAYASPADAQIRLWRDADGHEWVTNHLGGESVAVRPSSEAIEAKSRVASSSSAVPDREFYDTLIVEHARRNNLRPNLVRAVVQVESNYNPSATSPKGAMGLMQLMPGTAREFGVSNPYDPAQNIRGGTAYLRQLLDRYDDDEELALAAYNAGPGAVDRHGQSVPPYRETQKYVNKVSEIAGDEESVSPGTQFYVVIEIIDGREVKKYTNRKPSR